MVLAVTKAVAEWLRVDVLVAEKPAAFHKLPSAWIPALIAINALTWAFFNFIFIARVSLAMLYAWLRIAMSVSCASS